MAQNNSLYNTSEARWENYFIPAAAMAVSGTSDPDGLLASTVINDGTATHGAWLECMSGTALSQKHFTAVLPRRYISGTDVVAVVDWAPTSGTSAAGVGFDLEYSVSNGADGVFSDTVTLSATGTPAGTANTKQVTTLGTISGTDITDSGTIIGRIARNTGAAGDTYVDYIQFLGVTLRIRTTENGSVAAAGDG